MIQIALPNKGSLSEEAIELVKSAGYNAKRYGKELIVTDMDNGVDFYFLRPSDIPVYVSNGVLNAGITGRDLAIESRADFYELLPLSFGKSEFRYASHKNNLILPDSFNGKRIATSYTYLVERDLKEKKINAEIIHLDGAVEISIQLGVADVIADVVQTGKTLKEAGLEIVGESILKSEAVLIGKDKDVLDNKSIKSFVDRIKGITVARKYVMVEYDILEDKLKDACAVTPGIESPTVAPLSKKGWVAVKSMSRKKDINLIMDELEKLGAKGIIISEIRTCRI